MSFSGISNAYPQQSSTIYWPNRPDADSAASANNSGTAGETDTKSSAQGPNATEAPDFDSLFTPSTAARKLSEIPPLLTPSRENIDALTKYVSARVQDLLARNNIPAAPSEVSYGNDGQIEFPDDYAHTDQFKQALADDPITERAMRTLNALGSHHSAMQPSLAFAQEYGAASSQEAADAILAKYSDIFSDNRRYPKTALRFSPDGNVSVTSNGRPI